MRQGINKCYNLAHKKSFTKLEEVLYDAAMFSKTCSRTSALCTKSHIAWVRAESVQCVKAVASVLACLMLVAVAAALVLSAFEPSVAMYFVVVVLACAVALVAITARCEAYKRDPGFLQALELARLLSVLALQHLSKSDEGIKIADAVAIALAFLVRALIAARKAVSASRTASALRARTTAAKRVLISTTHTTSSLRSAATS